MTPAEWTAAQAAYARQLAEAAELIIDLSCACPHCAPRDLTECVLCRPVWHLGNALKQLAGLVAVAVLPPDVPEIPILDPREGI